MNLFYRRHRLLCQSLAAALVLLVALRVAAPRLILNKLNADLATMSPTYVIQIHRLHISFLRMFYRFEGVEGWLKKSDKQFLHADRIDVSVAWSELFRGRVLTDVLVDGSRLVLSRQLFTESKAPEAKPKEDAKKVRDKLFPVNVAAIHLERSSIQFGDFLGEPDNDTWRVSGIRGLISNLMPTKKSPFTYFSARGTMLQSSVLKLSGRARRRDQPLAWEVAAEVRDFDLKQTNPLVYHFFPLTFTAGRLDLFAEAKSQNGKLEGYVKPFIKKMHVIGDRRDFKGIKHFLTEVAVALGNVILRRPQDDSVATKVEFYSDAGKVKVKKDAAISTALEHGFGQPLSESLEGSVHLR